jgi:uncharacterized protein YerC
MSKPKVDKDIDIPDNILKQLLTASELRMLRNRFLIIQHLEQGLTIRSIAERVNVGTDTVVRVARMKERGSLRKNTGKAKEQTQEVKSQTPWIFGKK